MVLGVLPIVTAGNLCLLASNRNSLPYFLLGSAFHSQPTLAATSNYPHLILPYRIIDQVEYAYRKALLCATGTSPFNYLII